MNLGTVTFTLRAITAGFVRALQGAIAPLKALQQQANSVASSFRFIGGALAAGGLAGLVSELAKAEDSFLGLKAAMSGSIRDSQELQRNYQGLTRNIRALAVETGFSAVEISETATAFLRANVSVRQTAESLRGVINLARAEGDSLQEVADIAIDISKGFRLASGEFDRVADILVNASLASNVTIRQLGESFKYASGISREYNQSAESTAAILAVLGNAGQKASLAGTALRQIFVALEKDFAKQNSTLKRFNISLFEGGETVQTVNSKFRPLPDILTELGAKAATAGNFINVFQARALTAALAISDETADSFTQLVMKMGETGTAARLAEIRSQSLATQFARLKTTVMEFVISLGLQGGLIAQLKGAVDQVRSFFQGLSQLNPRMLQFISAVIVTSAQVALMIGGFVALSGAAAALLSPLGMAASALFGLTEAGKSGSIFEKYGKELQQLKDAFVEFASLVGNQIASVVTGAIADVIEYVGRAINSLGRSLGDFSAVGFVLKSLAGALFTVSSEAYLAEYDFKKLAETNQEVLQGMLNMLTASGGLTASLAGLSTAGEGVTESSKGYTAQIAEAQAVFAEIQGEITKLTDEMVPASAKIGTLIDSLRADPEARGTVLLLEEILDKAQRLEGQLALAGGKNPGELLASAFEIANGEIEKVQSQMGGFSFETQQLVAEIERLKAASAALGEQNAHVFDDLIAKVKQARDEQSQLFTVEFGRGIQNGINQMVSGLLRGTRESISAGELLRGALLSEFESLFQQIIVKKLAFDKVFKDNFMGLGKFAKETFSGIFSGASSLGSSAVNVGKSVLSAIGIPSFADGAIVGGGVLAMVGDAGPSGKGKEVISPLDKLRDIVGGGGSTNVTLITDQPAERVKVREIGEGGPDRTLEIAVGAIERNILQKGSIYRAVVATTSARPKTNR